MSVTVNANLKVTTDDVVAQLNAQTQGIVSGAETNMKMIRTQALRSLHLAEMGMMAIMRASKEQDTIQLRQVKNAEQLAEYNETTKKNLEQLQAFQDAMNVINVMQAQISIGRIGIQAAEQLTLGISTGNPLNYWAAANLGTLATLMEVNLVQTQMLRAEALANRQYLDTLQINTIARGFNQYD